jgi:hypothetical protein
LLIADLLVDWPPVDIRKIFFFKLETHFEKINSQLKALAVELSMLFLHYGRIYERDDTDDYAMLKCNFNYRLHKN